MSVTRTFDFNSGTDGATITATGIVNGVTGTPTYATAALKHGARGMYTGAAATTSDFIRWPRAVADTHSVSFYWQPLSISSSATAIWRAADSTNAVIGALRYRQSDNKWDIGNANQTVNFLSTQTFTLNHWYRINIKCNFADILNPVFTVDIYDPDETDISQTPYATFGGIIPTTLTYDRDLLGRIGTSTGTRDCYFDTLKIADNSLELIQAEVPIPTFTPFDYTVTTGDNDGSWNKVGTFSKTGTSLLVGDPSPSDYDRSVYVRVEGVPYTRGSTINEAHLTMTGLGLDTPAPDPVRIYGILAPNPDVPANNTDIRSRQRSVAFVDWSHTVNADSTAYNTPDIKTIVQELVNQTAWVPGNAMMFTLEDTVDGDVDGALSFYSYNNTPAKAPQFHSQYTPAAPDTTPSLLAMIVGNQSPTGFTVSCKSLRATTAAIEVSTNSGMTSPTTGATVTPSLPSITASWVPAGYAILASGLSQVIDVTAAPEGDWIYAFVVLDTNQTAVTMTGWTLRKEGDESTFTHYAVFRRKKLATDTTFTVSWPTSAKGEIGLIAYNGLDAITPDELVAANLHTAGTGYATPTLTPNNTTRWAAAFSWSRTSTSGNKAITWTPDAGMTERLDLNNSASPSTSPWTGIQIADTNGAVTLAAHTYTAVQAFTETHGGSVMLFLIPDSKGWCKPVITGLTAGTKYYYRIKLDGVRQTNLTGEANTFPAAGVAANYTFLNTSCANTNSNHAVFDAMRTYTGLYGSPLFMIHNGDFHYVYSGGGSAPNLTPVRRNEYENVLFNAPRQAELYRKVPQYYGWSDVDGCGSNCDGTYPGWPAVAAAYRIVHPHPTLPDSGGKAVYFSWAVGRVLHIRTDHRLYSSAKAATDDASKTNLGAEQEAWLITQLTDPTYPVKIWTHENKWVGNPVTDGNTDNWQTYSTVRQRIADVITANHVKVLYIHGDSHSFAADDGTNNPYGAFPYVVSAPMDKDAQVWTPPVTNGRYPDVAMAASQGFGAFDVTDTGTLITVAFKGLTADGTPRVTMSYSWSTATGANVRVADGIGGTVAATFRGVMNADGVTIDGATLRGWWDGSAIQPLA